MLGGRARHRKQGGEIDHRKQVLLRYDFERLSKVNKKMRRAMS